MIRSTLNEITSGRITIPAPSAPPEFVIDQNTQDIMDEIETGAAFDRSIINFLESMEDQWGALESEQDTLFGRFSPIRGAFSGLTDPTPLTLEDIENLNLRDDAGQLLESLVDRPRGPLLALKNQAETQFQELSDNITLYASHQRVQNAMGMNTGCDALSKHFGTITELGQTIAFAVRDTQVAIEEMRRLKTQLQSEIDRFDDNVINLLTGRVSGTILSEVVRGSGLYDQIDNILIEAGIADDSAEAQEIRSEVGRLLDPSLIPFFDQKTITNREVRKINNERLGIFGQIGREVQQFDAALTTLRKLGAANSLQGLFQANECIQTLMGFVATTPFLNKLGRI